MTASEFKIGIKELKENLKGLTLQLINTYSSKPYHTLSSFGDAILNEEKNGNSFIIKQAWTTKGIVKVNTMKQLAHLLINETVTGIQFQSFYQPTDFSDYLKNSMRTTE